MKGVSTRKVDDLVRAMGGSGISKSEVSRLVVELDTDLAAFRERRLDGTGYPYLWLDAQYERVRDGGRIVNAAFLVAIAVNERGEREVVGVIRISPWTRAAYDAARARGQSHSRAVRSFGARWCRILWHCWRDGVPYDPALDRQVHLAEAA